MKLHGYDTNKSDVVYKYLSIDGGVGGGGGRGKGGK